MFEILLGIIWEALLQIVLEALPELGLHSVAEPFRRTPNPWLAALGYALFGAIAGGLSPLAFPSHLVGSEGIRIANLIITPIAVGLVMCAMGVWRARRGQQTIRIDTFTYGYLFALTLVIVRFVFAR
ncbi:MAG: hypothetical protein FJ405_02220 [Verrucomicrobia bacterium]|nr:hypothetical protein [Verrucomicrobiota bacterium]